MQSLFSPSRWLLLLSLSIYRIAQATQLSPVPAPNPQRNMVEPKRGFCTVAQEQSERISLTVMLDAGDIYKTLSWSSATPRRRTRFCICVSLDGSALYVAVQNMSIKMDDRWSQSVKQPGRKSATSTGLAVFSLYAPLLIALATHKCNYSCI